MCEAVTSVKSTDGWCCIRGCSAEALPLLSRLLFRHPRSVWGLLLLAANTGRLLFPWDLAEIGHSAAYVGRESML